MREKGEIRLPPRLLNKKEAARYCGISEPIFDRICNVLPIALQGDGGRLRRYDLADLDDWIDQKKRANKNSRELTADEWVQRLGKDARAGSRP